MLSWKRGPLWRSLRLKPDVHRSFFEGGIMNWLQLIYEYIAGGLFFFITLYLCLATGATRLKNASDRKAVYYLLIGLAGYFFAMLGWILLASA
jgi:hypothetical protein